MARVMIIDDDQDFAGAAATVLRSAGHEVQIELEPRRAVASIEERPPDLIILDVMFPDDGAGGFKVARDLRQSHEKMRNVPILMLTAMNTRFPMHFDSSDIDEAWLPVDAFLEKPVDADVLREKVSSLLQQGAAGPPAT
jgi:DNA-binding response OmpR family regulator